ncbi:MAG: ABC transporter ATP-binding protein [Lacticaseibacillus paracasei]|uniref:ATP-binding cassette domain-containing protein n=1 Tax=Lacticaseibacillus paracasei TaxID=1597 RepID=UPI00345DE657
MMTATLIKFEQIGKNYAQQAAVTDFSLNVKRGEIFVLVGASGSGKTTIIRMINGLVKPTTGNIYFDGRKIETYNLRTLRFQIGYVLQQIALFPNMSVAQNVALIPSMKRTDKSKINRLVDQLLTDVNLEPHVYRNRMPDELSGGEKQRVGILRAFAAQPKVVLMDEPFSALDPISRTQLQKLVLTIHRKLRSTIIFVTHDMDEALKLGDRIGVMRSGSLLQVGTPQEIVQHPNDPFVRQLFEKSMSHDVYAVYLNKLDVLGYLQPMPDQYKGPELAQEQTVREAFTAFVSADQLAIRTKDHHLQLLTREKLYQFVSDYRNH